MKPLINVTDIISYLFCPRKLYLKLVKGIKEPPNQKMIAGFLKHKVFDIFNKNEQVLVSSIKEDINKEKITEMYEKYLTDITEETAETYSNMVRSFSINPDELLKDILILMSKEIKLRADSIKAILHLYKGKDLWRNLTPKYLTEFEIISYELGLKGRIDRVKFEEEIMPYELKTREEIYESDKLQLAAYSLLLEKEFNRKINKGIIEVKNKQEEIIITEQMKSQVLEIAEKIRKFEKDKEPNFYSNFNKCEYCRLKEECFN